jgi:hypothetical protein
MIMPDMENERQAVSEISQTIAQAEKKERRGDSAAFEPGVADAPREAAHRFDRPFFLAG